QAVGQGQPAGGQQAHGHRRCMPTAGGESAEDASFGGRFIEMKGLWVELRGERFYAALFHEPGSRGEALAYVQIFQIQMSHPGQMREGATWDSTCKSRYAREQPQPHQPRIARH